ncbi:DUF4307 domain-containing protein [Microbacterium aurugineum]|uniref:DUF4307 domain-containing protein n=1 Tax=Microbacterium aurugineum TaxID=2851642 RepID=A0ABY4J007_9MICO|nr:MULTISPECIES: DUF4307 domain-containing protein [Microbacterium]MCE0508428.1 DUF4307 domain-containing protein [Microbacterium sp. KKR3/1]MCK8466607.1 DUF4307 domain-containing protein [Microbacterium aurugineum]MCZ4300382.1 DUF4307 domain-containing protein [Microbacterium oxydans]QEA28967.1 DUF4307 domain-containing protein [Microbacterium sp. CBA3102]TCJ22253.1 DUF4307 domain-containing protein [Microbacterium sp. PI-1]
MTTAQQLDERYGRTRRRRLPWIIGGAVALVVIGAFSWMTVSQSIASVDADDLGFTLVDEYSVDVSFQVTGVQGKDVVCALEALDEEFGVVGWKIVEIAAGDSHSQAVSVTIPTVAQATTGLVNTCWVA